ncbi:hypothetical protein V8B55DRAFT_1368542 [Mucor lusitanicus]|uniref:NET domain-containing protein n=2 Tax=Mucor circinelloides f. lusitanicus TaxID=29924 RepID=A0A162RJY4_MUCCL|nr:hypothetical protein FB192DRAFT_1438528 [Mucor lusitanicus]OAD06639.1 hypothetical protein MUCCIDRAFT_160289 [Mucor lusitanicus CBS 277.49]
MGGVTIAHQPNTEVANDDNYSSSFPVDVKIDASTESLNDEQFNQLFATSAEWSNNLPVEDLTGEVQELMMRESMNSWLQPWGGENAACLSDFDTQMYAQSIQLENLFGQNQIDFTQDMTQTAFYDELAFAPDDQSLNLSASTSSASSPSDSSTQISPIVQSVPDVHIEQLEQQDMIVEKLQVLEKEDVQVNIEDEENDNNELVIEEEEEEQIISSNTMLKRRRSSSSSSDSSDDSSSGSSSEEESDSEDENVIPTTVANMSSRGRYASSSDSESESEATPGRRSRAVSPIANAYVYMHKRQIEETLLDRITNSLDPEKLPGILPILSPESNQQEDEVEIDLSCLAREQLVQVLSYVDACIMEQNGGPAVNVERYITKKPKGPRTRPALVDKKVQRRRKPSKPKTKSRAELTEDIDAGSSSDDEDDQEHMDYSMSKPKQVSEGPISMASLSKKNNTVKNNRRKPVAKKSKNRRHDDDALVSSSIHVIQDPDSIAISRPKRRAAVHKRRLLEEMLAPSDDEDNEDDEDNSPLVVFGEEKMDLGVIDNCTIMHQVPVIEAEQIVTLSSVVEDDNEDTDEEIDIMC